VAKPTDILPGTLDLLILRTLELGPLHGVGIADRIEQVTRGVFLVGPGSLFPALHRLTEKGWIEGEWRESETKRRVKAYTLTAPGRAQLAEQKRNWKTVFTAMNRDGIEAFLLPDINVRPTLLVELAARHRLPTIHSLSHVVTEWGGLAAYSTEASSVEDVVGCAVRILHGERAADLPVQEPTRFELILNARAARDLGLTFPPSLLVRANQVVEK